MVFRGLPHLHTEHDDLGGHGGHLVAETVLVQSIHVSSKCVLAVRLPLTRIYHSFVRASYLEGGGYIHLVCTVKALFGIKNYDTGANT